MARTLGAPGVVDARQVLQNFGEDGYRAFLDGRFNEWAEATYGS
ncbi:MAG: hypothetical protein ACRDQF_07055 [Thermocrispum sp.]